MTVAYEDFLPEVLIEVDGCPSKVAENAIRNAVIEFCQKVPVWKQELDPITTIDNIGTYDVDLPEDSQMVQVLWAKHDGTNLNPASEQELDTLLSQYRVTNWRTETGTPVLIFASSQKEVTLVRIPETGVAGGLVIGAQLAPDRNSFDCPETIYEEYLELIACGAKARLMDMSTRTWYNPSGAAKELVAFNRGIVSAKIKESKSHGRMSNTVAQRPFA